MLLEQGFDFHGVNVMPFHIKFVHHHRSIFHQDVPCRNVFRLRHVVGRHYFPWILVLVHLVHFIKASMQVRGETQDRPSILKMKRGRDQVQVKPHGLLLFTSHHASESKVHFYGKMKNIVTRTKGLSQTTTPTIMSNLQTMIKTDRSFLTQQPLNNITLVGECVEEIKEKLLTKPPIKIRGKEMNQRRDIGFFSNESIGYQYSGQMAASQPLTPALLVLLDTVNTMYEASFNGILVNRYQDGTDYISAHSDNEKMLDKVGVVSVSYGGQRTFRIRNKSTKAIVQDIRLLPGLILHMGGEFQKEFTHEIPVEKRVKDTRYSFTFRKHLE